MAEDFIHSFKLIYFITGRNEVVAKVIFLHLFVILFTGGGGSASMQVGIPTPPGPGRHPPRSDPLDQTPPPPRPGRHPQIRHPLDQTPQIRHHHPPWTRQTPPRSDTPQIRHHHPPSRTRQTIPGKQTPAYGLRAAGTHPTGMHSCLSNILTILSVTCRGQTKILTKFSTG